MALTGLASVIAASGALAFDASASDAWEPGASTRTASGAFAAAADLPRTVVIGQSRQGRGIIATRQGDPRAAKVLVIVGQMHGDERRAPLVVDRVRRLTPPPGVAMWTIRTLNPDGAAHRTRRNARDVDINRNFPFGWSSHVVRPGPRAGSEPETRAVMRFLTAVRPDALVSFHQPFGLIDAGTGKARNWGTFLAKRTGVPVGYASCGGPCAGTMTSWFNATLPGWALTFEFGPNPSNALLKKTARVLVDELAPAIKDVA